MASDCGKKKRHLQNTLIITDINTDLYRSLIPSFGDFLFGLCLVIWYNVFSFKFLVVALRFTF